MKRLLYVILCTGAFTVLGQQAELPPELPWSGKSESVVRSPLDEWAIKAEQTEFSVTSTYSETREWCSRLVKQSRWVHERVIGKSAEGREIIMLLVSKEKKVTPEILRSSSKPVLLIQAGIHAGEIDGKDAGMMWLRDVVLRDKGELLDHMHILFIPILNVDGHERASMFNRPNQRGPENMGWRSNARNRNLNRDYTKLDAEEIRAVVNVLNAYDPDLYFDIHVTDGADYQYDITYGFSGMHGYSPAISAVLNESFQPVVNTGLEKWGHVPGPLMLPLMVKIFPKVMRIIPSGRCIPMAMGLLAEFLQSWWRIIP
jgi:murein tripeptide amidase MpaA